MSTETGSGVSERRMHESPNFRFDLETLERLKNGNALELADVFSDCEAAIGSADLDDKRRAQLLKLLDDAKELTNRYVERVIESTEASEVPFPEDQAERSRYQNLVQATDRARRQTHMSLVDSLNALFRNMMKMGVPEAEAYAKALSGDPNDAVHRRKVGEAAVLYGWEKAKKATESGPDDGGNAGGEGESVGIRR